MANRERISRTVTRITGRRAPVPVIPTIPPIPAPLDSWPVNSIYISMAATSPATLLGGTWVRCGQGRMMVGQDPGDVDFDTSFEVGGEKYHYLVTGEMPVHDHNVSGLTIPTREGDNLTPKPNSTASAYTNSGNRLATAGGTAGTTAERAWVTGPTNPAGSGNGHYNMPPYFVVYMWMRTA